MKLLSALILSTTLAFSGAALANEAGKDGGKRHHGDFFKKADTNGDGVISKEEHQAHSDKMFDKLDANHDGNVTKEEGKAAHEKMRAKWQEKHGEKGGTPATSAVIKKGDSAPASK